MSTAHIEAKIEDIAKKVLMPGDPLRAKYIADHFLTDVKLVNTVRNMYAYTGYYKTEKITVFPSGMGIASIGIYAYELYRFYDVEKIIRIGTCGTNKLDANILDVVLASSSYSLSNYPKLFDGDDLCEIEASKVLNQKIIDVSSRQNIPLTIGTVITSDVFDPYIDFNQYIKNYPNREFVAMEMESFCLFYLAQKFHKDAACLLTIVDIIGKKISATSDDREKSLKVMIQLALDSII